MSTSTVAMEDDVRRNVNNIVYHTGAKYRLVDPDVTLVSEVKSALTNGHKAWKKSLAEKTERTYDLVKKTINGDYGDLTGELIEGFVAHLMGKGLYHQLLQPNVNFDASLQAEVMTNIQMQVCDFLTRQLTKDKEAYGIVDSTGERVTLYRDISLFRMVAEKIGVPNLPCGSAIISGLDFDPVKKFMTNKFNQLVLNQLSNLTLYMTGNTIKNHVGTQFINLINMTRKGVISGAKATAKTSATLLFAPYDEVSISSEDVLKNDNKYGPLWEYLEPHITHYLRQTFESILNKSQVTIVSELTKKAQQTSAPLVQKGIKIGMTTVGGLTGYIFGGFSGMGGGLGVGNVLSEFVGPYVAGMTHHQIEQFSKIANDQLDKFITWKMHNLFKYSKEEHALYGLNPKQPTHLELALFSEDYKLRAKLESETILETVIKQLAQSFDTVDMLVRSLNVTSEGAKNAVNKVIRFFSGSQDVPTPEIVDVIVSKYQTDLAGALRQYLWLKKKAYLTFEERRLLENIEKYPSYAIKSQFLTDLNEQFKTIHPEEYLKRIMTNKESAKSKEEEEVEVIGKIKQSVTEICSYYQHLTRERMDQDYFDYVNLEDLLEAQIFLLPIEDQQRLIEVGKDKEYIKAFIDEAIKDNEKRTMLACEFDNAKDAKKVAYMLNQLLLGHSKFRYKGDLEKLQKRSFAYGMSMDEMIKMLESDEHHASLNEAGFLGEVPDDVSREVQQSEINVIRDRFFELAQKNLTDSYFEMYKINAEDYVKALIHKKIKSDSGQQLDVENIATFIDKEIIANTYMKKFLEPINTGDNKQKFEKARRDFYELLKGQNRVWVKEFLAEAEKSVPSIDESATLDSLTTVISINDHISVYGEDDVQGVKLAELYNQYMEENCKSIEELQESDFIAIWNMLNQQKSKNLQNRNVSADDLKFIAEYRTELLHVRQNSKRFQGKLFYGYMDLVNELRQQNAQFLATLR